MSSLSTSIACHIWPLWHAQSLWYPTPPGGNDASWPLAPPWYIGILFCPMSMGTGWLFIHDGALDKLYHDAGGPELLGAFSLEKNGCL
jgi:hypothetical protein